MDFITNTQKRLYDSLTNGYAPRKKVDIIAYTQGYLLSGATTAGLRIDNLKGLASVIVNQTIERLSIDKRNIYE